MVGTLGFVIASNACLFMVVNAVLLRPLPYGQPDRLVMIHSASKQSRVIPVSYPDFLDWREQSSVFENLSVVRRDTMVLTGVERPEYVAVASVSASYFRTLGVGPVVGRDLVAEDDRLGATPVALLSYGLWQRWFGGESSVLHRAIAFDGLTYKIVGVLPSSQSVQQFDAWIPIGLQENALMNRKARPALRVVARLRSDIGQAQAQSEMEVITARLATTHPEADGDLSASVVPLHEQIVSSTRTTLLFLSGMAVSMLFAACVNIGSLSLAQAPAKVREIAMRITLGSPRRRLFLDALREQWIVTGLGAALGLAGAALAPPVIVGALPDAIPRAKDASFDGSAILFTLLISLLCVVVFALVPVLVALKIEPARVLAGSGNRFSTRHPMQGIFVGGQVGLAVCVSLFASLIGVNYVAVQSVDGGYNIDRLSAAPVALPAFRYRTADQMTRFFRALVELVAMRPEVEAAAVVSHLPLTGFRSNDSISLVDSSPQKGPEQAVADYLVVSPGYFRAMGVALLAGRDFGDNDTVDSTRVAIIDKTLAGRLWPDGSPVGERFRFTSATPPIWWTVVGVAGSVRQHALDGPPPPLVYLPVPQRTRRTMHLVVRMRSSADADSMIRQALSAVDKEQPMGTTRTFAGLRSEWVSPRRLTLVVAAVFGSMCLLLALIGTYGIMQATADQRCKEIGVRLSVGASPFQIGVLLLRRGFVPAIVGSGSGFAAFLVMRQVIHSRVPGLASIDPVITAGTIGAVVACAAVSAVLPARRAAAITPADYLRLDR